MKISQLLPIITVLIIYACKNEIPKETPKDVSNEIAAIERGLMKAVVVKGAPLDTFSIEERMDHYNVPGVSIALVKDGEIRWAKGYGFANTQTEQKVDTTTLFQAGSISKPLAALGALKLVQEGKMELDKDINIYFKDWKIKGNGFTDSSKVTLRRLLTHTAGITVHGFPGYKQKDSFPNITEVLDGKGNTPRIFADTIPGSIWRYSGGGYTIMEKAVEDVTGVPLDNYLDSEILSPLGMKNSTFSQPLKAGLYSRASAAYNGEGELIEGLWHNYPEQAAAGLWTTPSDLARYCLAVQKTFAGDQTGPLSKTTIDSMLTKHKNDWGLGPGLLDDEENLKFGHGGKNAGFTNRLIAYANKQDAVIIMTNADRGGNLISEIMRSVSAYYGWDIETPKEVTLADASIEALDTLTGKYILDQEVPGIGKYYVDISRKDHHLEVTDPNNGDFDILYALDHLQFIDLEDGDEVQFLRKGDDLEMIWNNTYRFTKSHEN